jgi:hypothetical protein
MDSNPEDGTNIPWFWCPEQGRMRLAQQKTRIVMPTIRVDREFSFVDETA